VEKIIAPFLLTVFLFATTQARVFFYYYDDKIHPLALAGSEKISCCVIYHAKQNY
jgi:hypothetical protein